MYIQNVEILKTVLFNLCCHFVSEPEVDWPPPKATPLHLLLGGTALLTEGISQWEFFFLPLISKQALGSVPLLLRQL